MKILVVNGVNINMVGKREPIYGSVTLAEINEELKSLAQTRETDIEFFQSNIEGEIVDRLQKQDYDALIINPGAYSHYSIAIADALAYVAVPKIEVHLTNIFAREEMRHESITAKNCNGVVCGLGADGYYMALEYVLWKNNEE